MKTLLFTSLCILFVVPNLVAQEHLNCGTQEMINKQWTQNPHLEKEWKNTFGGSTEKEDDTTIFIIPVVFHILHEYGTENISDAQVQSAMDILNRDYRLLNSDTSDVIQDFKHLYADAKIEFRLARLDPNGNCTNGIDRIYTHLTNNADDNSKINQWNRANYLNIWVVNTIGQAGVSGYTYYPNITNGTMSSIDGVLMKHQYVGSIGTGSINLSRILGHEIAHYLNLPHPNATIIDSSTGCGDDGIADTPITAGTYYNCDMVGPWDFCTPGVNENFQNYMVHSYCTRMFTIGQVAHMRAALQSTHGQRNELTTPQAHAATGIDFTSPACIPIADFNAFNKTPCVGTSVSFRDASYNAPVTSYEWIFQDGNPATSSIQHPLVTFTTPGYKTITLVVANATGSDTLIREQYIRVNDTWGDFTGPKMLDLNDANSHPEWFHIENPGDNWAKFHYNTTNGKGGGGCFKLNNYKNITGLPTTHPDANYYNQLGEAKDRLITPSYDLRFTTGATLSFDYSYATSAQSIGEITELLNIAYSNNCGSTWTQIGGFGMTGTELVTSGLAFNGEFVPTSENQWATKILNIPSNALAAKTMFRLTFNASDKSNNLYIDNINIQGTGFAGFNDFAATNALLISPNPVVSGNNLKIEYTALNEPVTFTLRNLQGAEVLNMVRNETNQFVSFDLEIGNQLPASYYFLEVKSTRAITVQKIVVVKQ